MDTVEKGLRIVMTVDPEIPVPPLQYGGIERIVDMLVRGLINQGHEVHLFANPGSSVPAQIVPYRGLRSLSICDTVMNGVQIWRHVRSLRRVDLVHSFGRLAYLLPLMRSSIPKIQSYQRPVSKRSIRLGRALAGESLTLTACSRYCASTAGAPDMGWVIVPNGVPAETYAFRPAVEADAPLVFLGRVERIKGAHTAIEVARRADRRLLIAGNRAPDGSEREYFEREIVPRCDGRDIRYIGPVTDVEKNELLGKAAALLFPVEWGEPFGIVMVEALACGTPVIAFGRGAVPEVVEDGATGFLCDSVPEMMEAVRRIPSLERGRCREAYEGRFSDRVIVKQYELLYRTVVEKARGVESRQ
jgi:glycosyltransferase involved in cell wall biosynthesis